MIDKRVVTVTILEAYSAFRLNLLPIISVLAADGQAAAIRFAVAITIRASLFLSKNINIKIITAGTKSNLKKETQ